MEDQARFDRLAQTDFIRQQNARSRAGKGMHEKLADELIDAANERGEAVRKREETHRMADANKAFAHYRW